jgi:uncharacterized protein YndB with AHSA1/START domain
MTAAPVVHDTFTLERTYQASPAQVYAAWSNIDAKARWFNGPEHQWKASERSLDFRPGGQERVGGTFVATGRTSLFVATYFDILDERRIVYAYEMFVDGVKISVSLASIELSPAPGGGTRMVLTEQGAYFDGKDGATSRRAGTEGLMKQFAAALGEPERGPN